jgi:uncharacterized membrane protein
MKESPVKSKRTKKIVLHLVSELSTWIIAYLLTNDFYIATSIVALGFISKQVIRWVFQRFWSLNSGQDEINNPDFHI